MNPPKKQSPPTTANTPSSILRNPRGAVVAASSPSRRRETFSGGIVPAAHARCDNPQDGEASKTGDVAALKLTKAHRTLSRDNRDGGSGPVFAEAAQENTSSRRHASMPQSRTAATTFSADHARTPSPFPAPAPVPPLNQAKIDIANDRLARARGSVLPKPDSPPLVDFTQFGDTYRGPRSRFFEGLAPLTKTKAGRRSVSGGSCRPDGSAAAAAMKMKDRYPALALAPARTGGAGPHHPHPSSSSSSTPHGVSVPAAGGGGGLGGRERERGGLSPSPASARKPDPRRVLSALEGMLSAEYKISDYLHAHELLGMHQLDQLDFEERDRARAGFAQTGKLNVRRGERESGVISVLGEPIRAASIYASVPLVLSGREHELPIVVVHTVEELYRTGIHQPGLFRRLPNRQRLMELINIYDSEDAPACEGVIDIRPRSSGVRGAMGTTNAMNANPNANERNGKAEKAAVHPGFGALTSLHLESTPDVCALLTTYISSLREPVLCRFLFDAIWDWCGVADELEPETETDKHSAGHDHSAGGTTNGRGPKYPTSSSFPSIAPRRSSIPLARTYTSPEDATRIATAQLLLHLLPSPHFSLLVYLLAFFSEVARASGENGVGVPDLARMYGGRIFGGDRDRDDAGRGHGPGTGTVEPERTHRTSTGARARGKVEERVGERARDGETMMRWFLRRWRSLSEGLFDALDDASMGLFRRTHARRDSFGKDVLSSWSLVDGGSKGEGEEEEEWGDVETIQRGVRVEDAEDEDESVLDSVTAVRDRAFATRRPTLAARATDYVAAGTRDDTQSSRSRLLRAHSISDWSLSDLGMNADNLKDADESVMLSSTRNQGNDTLDISHLPPASKGNYGSNERLDDHESLLDLTMSELMDEVMSFPSKGNDREHSARPGIPEIIVNGATPPNQTPPHWRSPEPIHLPAPALQALKERHTPTRSARSTIIAPSKPSSTQGTGGAPTGEGGQLEDAHEIVSKLREENATLHNTVWRLEAELAQLRRDFYAASSSGARTSAALEMAGVSHTKGSICAEGERMDISLGAQDAEAVRIVAEIRRLMARN